MKSKAFLNNSIIIFIGSCIIIYMTAMFCVKILVENTQETVSSASLEEIKINQNPVVLDEILKENTKDQLVEEMVSEEIDLEYTTEYRNNDSLPKGRMQVVQEGRDGRQEAIVIKKYKENELISEELVSENLIKASVNRIVEIGTGSGVNNYNPKEGDTVYVTSNLLTVRLYPDKESEKVCTLKKDDEIKISKVEGEYLYVISKEQNGYIPIDCITNIEPNSKYVETGDEKDTYSKSVLLAKLSFNMDVGKPSGFSLNQFNKVLANQVGDKNNVFKDNAEYFYYAEKQYGINGIFLAAVAIHESGFGTSTISNNKKNLFGYGAVDSNPYGGAYSFNTYSEGIDLLARVFMKYYLNPNGSKIYDGNIADGRFYNGSTVSSVNIRYASDKNWANSVYKWMTNLYNSL